MKTKTKRPVIQIDIVYKSVLARFRSIEKRNEVFNNLDPKEIEWNPLTPINMKRVNDLVNLYAVKDGEAVRTNS
jgi:hypothetical protein